MQTRPVLGYGAAYISGGAATPSPCILASIPLIIGFVREGKIRLEDCPPLPEEQFREKREKLRTYLESFGWSAL